MTASTATLPIARHTVVASSSGRLAAPPASRAERRDRGRRRRRGLPREAHAELVLSPDETRSTCQGPGRRARAEPGPDQVRAHELVALCIPAGRRRRHGPRPRGWTVFRPGRPAVRGRHLDNFGMFAAPDRRLVFDLNDFDETHPGPFEWDVKRLAASVVVAARHRGVRDKRARRAAAATVTSYRTTMSSLSRLDPMSLFYVRLEVKTWWIACAGPPWSGDARRASKDSRNNTGDAAAGKLTEMREGRRRFATTPHFWSGSTSQCTPGSPRTTQHCSTSTEAVCLPTWRCS